MEIATGNRKSEKLTKEEKKLLRKWVSEQPTKLIAADALGIAPNTLDRILLAGSGNPESINKIREKLNQSTAA